MERAERKNAELISSNASLGAELANFKTYVREAGKVLLSVVRCTVSNVLHVLCAPVVTSVLAHGAMGGGQHLNGLINFHSRSLQGRQSISRKERLVTDVR